MGNLNLVLKFKLAGDPEVHVKGASRIKVDGRGGLRLYNAQGAAEETIDLCQLQSLWILSMARVVPRMPVLAPYPLM